MPLVETTRDYLKPFVENYKKILDEYESVKDQLIFVSPPQKEKWKLASLIDARGWTKNSTITPYLKSLIEELPENITVSMIMFSIAEPGLSIAWHTEPYPMDNNFRCFHLPLDIPEGIQFEECDYVLHPEGQVHGGIYPEDVCRATQVYKWEEGKLYDFTTPLTAHRSKYPSGEKDRVMLILNILEEKSTEETILKAFNVNTSFVDDIKE